jgi:hypothetical protein
MGRGDSVGIADGAAVVEGIQDAATKINSAIER